MDSCTPLVFKEILETQTISEILDYFNKPAPCSLLGFLMKLIGNSLLRHIHILKNKHVFFPLQEIQQLQLLNGGEMLLTSKGLAVSDQSYHKFITNVK